MADDESQDKLHQIERSSLRGHNGRARAAAPVRRRTRTEETIARPPRRKGGSWVRFVIVFLIIAGVVVTLLTTTFATADISVTLRVAPISFDGVYRATREPSSAGDISYSVRGPLQERRSAVISNVREEPQFTKSEGTVTIFNTNTSGEALDLINRTRLETEDGRIYRVIGKQVIPGGKTVGDSFVPGEKEVPVEADDVGNTYDIRETGERFSIPGLQKWKAFAESYAISKTAIVGGFEGTRLIPDAEEVKAARERLQREIQSALQVALEDSLQTSSLTERVVFDSGIFITFESLENEQSEGAVTIREEGTLRAVSFRMTALASLLATHAASAPAGVKPRRVDVENIVKEIESNGSFDVISSTEFDFRLSGDAVLYWDVDEVLLLEDLAGSAVGKAGEIILNKYPQIVRHDPISVFPIWRTTIPATKAKIHLEKVSETVEDSKERER